MKILIRVDASLEIGTGHVFRCLSLAKALKVDSAKASGHQVIFACRQHPGNLIEAIENSGFEVIKLNESSKEKKSSTLPHSHWLGTTQEADAQELLRKLPAPFDWIIVDHYALDATWEKLVKPQCRSLFAIDDLADRKHVADLLLDQNEYLNKEKRYADLVTSKCLQLLGPGFALLRDEFQRLRASCAPRVGKINQVLISYGGVDPTNETAKAIGALIPFTEGKIKKIDVVIGPTNPHGEKLKTLLKDLPHFELHINTSRMGELMARSDLSLGAGGTMTWERCALGLPAIATVLFENQKEVSIMGEKAGFQLLAGHQSEITVESLSKMVQSLISNPERVQKMSKIAWQTVDAKGTQRVTEYICK